MPSESKRDLAADRKWVEGLLADAWTTGTARELQHVALHALQRAEAAEANLAEAVATNTALFMDNLLLHAELTKGKADAQ